MTYAIYGDRTTYDALKLLDPGCFTVTRLQMHVVRCFCMWYANLA